MRFLDSTPTNFTGYFRWDINGLGNIEYLFEIKVGTLINDKM